MKTLGNSSCISSALSVPFLVGSHLIAASPPPFLCGFSLVSLSSQADSNPDMAIGLRVHTTSR